MRHRITALALCALAAAPLAHAADPFAALKVDEAQAREETMNAIVHRTIPLGIMGRAFRQLSTAERAVVVQDFTSWAKSYTASPEFKQAYAQAREASKPQPAAELSGSVDDAVARQRAEQGQQVAELKKALAALPPDQRKEAESRIDDMFAGAIAQAKDPEFQKAQRQAIEAQRAERKQQYESATKAWAEDYPADPAVLIARRLQEFLAVSGDVDWSATVAGSGTFADGIYERKSNDWKLCYRAGKEAITAARAAAAMWLKDLGK